MKSFKDINAWFARIMQLASVRKKIGNGNFVIWAEKLKLVILTSIGVQVVCFLVGELKLFLQVHNVLYSIVNIVSDPRRNRKVMGTLIKIANCSTLTLEIDFVVFREHAISTWKIFSASTKTLTPIAFLLLLISLLRFFGISAISRSRKATTWHKRQLDTSENLPHVTTWFRR